MCCNRIGSKRLRKLEFHNKPKATNYLLSNMYKITSHYYYYKAKGKGKVVPVPFFYRAPRHDGVLGSGGIAPRIIGFRIR